MTLIYAYIQKYKNYAEQSILFNTEYNVQFQEGLLSFSYAGTSAARSLLRGERKEDHLHFLVGKTGSGKTNLLQLIGNTRSDIGGNGMGRMMPISSSIGLTILNIIWKSATLI